MITKKWCGLKTYLTQWTQTSLRRLQNLFKRSRRLTIHDVWRRTRQDVRFTTSWRRRIYVVLKMPSLRGLENVWFTTSWNVGFRSTWRCRIYDVLKRSVKQFVEFQEDVLATSHKKVVATSISDQSKTSLRLKLKMFYDVFAASLCRLAIR